MKTHHITISRFLVLGVLLAPMNAFSKDITGDLDSSNGSSKWQLRNAATTNLLSVLSNGNVGISSATPGGLFQVGNGTFTVLSGGNVGVGTDTPAEKLHVQGNMRFSGALMPNNSAGTSGYILQSGGAGTSPTWVSTSSFSGNFILNQNSLQSGATFYVSSGSVDGQTLLARTSGNVGIGNASPTSFKLEVTGDIGPSADNLYDLGSTSKRWKSLHVGPGSVVVHRDASDTNKMTLDFSGANARAVTDASTPLQLTVGTTTGLFLATNGNIGVGTTIPRHTFHIHSNSTNPNNSYITFSNSLTTLTQPSLLGMSGTTLAFYNLENGQMTFGTNNSQRAVIEAGGNVGIGTIGPAGLFQVGNGTFTVLSGGNVGIGSASPGALLDVSGKFITDTGNSIRLRATDGSNEGGQTQFDGAGSYQTWYHDLYQNTMRLFSGGVAGQVQIFNTSGAENGLYVEGNVGIGDTSTAAKLDVYTTSANSIGVEARDDGGGRVWMTSELGAGGYNPMSQAGDVGIIYYGPSGSNTGAIMIGQWSSSSRGIRIDSNGDVTISGGSGKLDVGTIDPPYTINGEKFATYVSGMVGQKEEVSGVLQLKKVSASLYQFEINFSQEPKGSDRWLFSKTTQISKHFQDLAVLLTPSFDGKLWYEKDIQNLKVTVFASPAKESSGLLEVSYRLTAPRFDADKWKNTRDATETSPGFIINDQK